MATESTSKLLDAVKSAALETKQNPFVSVNPEIAELHESIFTLDTHLDTPANLVAAYGFDIHEHHAVTRDGTQVDVPRMIEGGLDGGFWVIYTPQGPLTPEAYANVRDTALLRARAIYQMAIERPDVFALATTATDAHRINDEGKKVVFQAIENSYPLGEDLSLLETFYKLGVRMVGPVHSSNNQFADSSTDADGPRWNGLSPLGRELVEEANRLGIVVDGSHASDEALDQMIDLSATPLILSHSGTNEVYDHPRNVPDALLVKLAESGGVIQMNALGRYLKDIKDTPERTEAISALREKWGNPRSLAPDSYETYLDELAAINKAHPQARAGFEDFAEQMIHALDLLGPEHVGIGADWDGGGGVAGLDDISYLPKITERLVAEGYSKEDIEKIWSGNLLRVVKASEDYAANN